MKTPRNPRLAVTVLASTLLVLATGCGTQDQAPSSDAKDPATSQSTSPDNGKTKADTTYIDLWEEFASFYTAASTGEIAEASSAAAVNASLGWDEESLAAFVSFDEGGACLVSLDGVYLSIDDSASAKDAAVTMGEGIDCPPDATDARVVLAPSEDFESFAVTRGADLLPSGTFISDVDYTATSGAASAAEAVKSAAVVVESTATYEPGKQVTADEVKATLVETEDFVGKVNLTWVDPQSAADLGYDLCVSLLDGSWASWDSVTSQVKDSGDLGGCPA